MRILKIQQKFADLKMCDILLYDNEVVGGISVSLHLSVHLSRTVSSS